jgi:hypothetical protein
MTRSLQDQPNASAGRRFRNTAELSGELSVGDVVAAGDVLLAVARAGWDPVTGPLAEVRTSAHGTRPLPEPAPPGGPLPDPAAPAAKETRDERP